MMLLQLGRHTRALGAKGFQCGTRSCCPRRRSNPCRPGKRAARISQRRLQLRIYGSLGRRRGCTRCRQRRTCSSCPRRSRCTLASAPGGLLSADVRFDPATLGGRAKRGMRPRTRPAPMAATPA